MALLVSIFFGFVPMFLFAGFINWLDRYEKEPKILLGATFMWGVLIAGGGAYIINTVLGMGVYIVTGSEGATDFATASIIAPIVEESLKGLAVLVVFLLFRKEFDSILDGVIYAGITALGFAAIENVLYIYNYGYQEGGWSGLGGPGRDFAHIRTRAKHLGLWRGGCRRSLQVAQQFRILALSR